MRLDEARGVHGEVDFLPARRHRHAACREGRRAIAGALGERRNPEPEMASGAARFRLELTEGWDVERGDRGLHGLHVARLVEGEAGRRDVGKLPDQIAKLLRLLPDRNQ